jgi:hypothetical protein
MTSMTSFRDSPGAIFNLLQRTGITHDLELDEFGKRYGTNLLALERTRGTTGKMSQTRSDFTLIKISNHQERT